MSRDHDDHGYSLVMPFVLCQSEGGHLDDTAFTFGWECGRLDADLAVGLHRVERILHADVMPQADLIAMKHGYNVEAKEDDAVSEVAAHIGWRSVAFTKSG